jgi:ribosome biogenesis GTPase
MQKGLIIKAIGGFYYVETSGSVVYECRARGIFRKNEISPVVGDWVMIEPEEHLKGTVCEILPRKNELVRPPLANLDQLFLIVSIQDPSPNLFIIDQFLAMSEHKGIDPILIITKTDLADGQELADIYRHAGFPVYMVSTQIPASLDPIKDCLRGKISAFTGNTGVGKSSFLNLLAPELQLKTADISKKLGRGRHTTRHVELYYLAEVDGYVADTPGFSTMDLARYDVILKEDLPYCFREFEPYLNGCRFTGCSHTVEKGCAVLQALKDGKIEPSRHQSYVALYEEAKKIKTWELESGGKR